MDFDSLDADDIIEFEVADPDYEHGFRSLSNYFESIAGIIHKLYGPGDRVVDRVLAAVIDHPPLSKVQRRVPVGADRAAIDRALRFAWGMLVRNWRELEDPDTFDVDSNALLPNQGYYAVFHGVHAFALASGQSAKPDHRSLLNLFSKQVTARDLLPYPWVAVCSSCHAGGGRQWAGFPSPVTGETHVLSNPEHGTSADRLAKFLRTTRDQQLKKRFDLAREKKSGAGGARKNLSKAEKIKIDQNLAPTTMLDLFWRMRMKVSYQDAEVLVLGASGIDDARNFAESFVTVTDASVAALEGAVSRYTGPEFMLEAIERYQRQKQSVGAGSPIAQRLESWSARSQAFGHTSVLASSGGGPSAMTAAPSSTTRPATSPR